MKRALAILPVILIGLLAYILIKKAVPDDPVKVAAVAQDSKGAKRAHATESPAAKKNFKDIIEDTTDPQQRRETIQRLFREAAHVASSSGNFDDLKQLFAAIHPPERLDLSSTVFSVFSKLGPSHDLPEKIALIESVGVDQSTITGLKRWLFEAEARERYSEMKDQGVLAKLSPEDFSTVCISMARVRMSKGFQALENAGDDSTRRQAAASLANFAIHMGNIEASGEIRKMSRGILRDEAVAELVIWLRKEGLEEDAQTWFDTITDEQAAERATGK